MTSHRWTDETRREVRVDLGDGRVMTIPATLDNADYRRLVEGERGDDGNVVVAPVEIGEPG